MLDMTNGNKKPDDEVVFDDGFLYIISLEEEASIGKNGYTGARYSIAVKCLCAEYDETITLADIAKEYPNVHKVIFDDCLSGCVFNYGNHCSKYDPDAEMWELVGRTLGYA